MEDVQRMGSEQNSLRMDSTRRRSAVPTQVRIAPRFGTRRRCALPRQARFPFRVVRRKWKRKIKGGH